MAAALLTTSAIAAAEVPVPEGWRRESFAFPLAFAPKIAFEGTEEVRFAPGWARFDAPEGFTYAFAWEVKRTPVDAPVLDRALREYFDGLMENVTRGRRIEDPGTATTTTLNPMAAPEGWQAGFGGRVFTWNGFAKGEPLQLHLEIAHRPCGAERMQVFFALSKAARDDPAWKALRELRAATRC